MAPSDASFSERLAGYEPVIGLEVHAQLLTRTKLFCSCANRFGDPPNTHVCPVCLGLPGALPVLSREAVTLAMKAALATHCTVQGESIWARKNYFYPDLPKGYQISQYEKPLALEGWVEIPSPDNEPRRIRLQRIHMEEDAGKLLHEGFPWSGEKSGVDLNRSGVPLIEMVTHPDLRSPEDAFEYLSALKSSHIEMAVGSEGHPVGRYCLRVAQRQECRSGVARARQGGAGDDVVAANLRHDACGGDVQVPARAESKATMAEGYPDVSANKDGPRLAGGRQRRAGGPVEAENMDGAVGVDMAVGPEGEPTGPAIC